MGKGFLSLVMLGTAGLVSPFYKPYLLKNTMLFMLKVLHPAFDDERFYRHARLVTSAVIAKIHTIDWTVELLKKPYSPHYLLSPIHSAIKCILLITLHYPICHLNFRVHQTHPHALHFHLIYITSPDIIIIFKCWTGSRKNKQSLESINPPRARVHTLKSEIQLLIILIPSPIDSSFSFSNS